MASESSEMEKSYIGDVVLGASDGLVTTFAVVAGVAGANLAPSVTVILGFAKLFADALSMAAGVYLGHESEQEALRRSTAHSPQKSAAFTFAAFIGLGAVPLIPYLFALTSSQAFFLASVLAGLTIFGVGAARTIATHRPWFSSGFEMLFITSLAAAVAFIVGKLFGSLV